MGIWSDLFGNSFPKKASLALDGLVGFFSTLSGRSFPPEITTNNRCLKPRVPYLRDFHPHKRLRGVHAQTKWAETHALDRRFGHLFVVRQPASSCFEVPVRRALGSRTRGDTQTARRWVCGASARSETGGRGEGTNRAPRCEGKTGEGCRWRQHQRFFSLHNGRFCLRNN